MSPVVSAVIPTFNRAELLKRAVQSVLDQTLKDLEIIIVDDHSTDETLKVVTEFTDKRIRYIRHPVNRRLPAARNTGVMAAQGEFVAFLDDDRKSSGRLARVLCAC